MWCNDCQQDVPAVTSSTQDRVIRCARCAQTLPGIHAGNHRPAQSVAEPPTSPNGPQDTATNPFDNVDFSDLWSDQLDSLLEPTTATRTARPEQHNRASQRSQKIRIDPGPETKAPVTLVEEPADAARSDRHSKPSPHSLSRLLLALSMGLLVCGASLMGWSLIAHRPLLWQLGLPLLLVGQVSVVALVISQLEAVWHSHCDTLTALHNMDRQFRQLSHSLQRQAPSADHTSPTSDQANSDSTSPHIQLGDDPTSRRDPSSTAEGPTDEHRPVWR